MTDRLLATPIPPTIGSFDFAQDDMGEVQDDMGEVQDDMGEVHNGNTWGDRPTRR